MHIGINVTPASRGRALTLDELIAQVAQLEERHFASAVLANVSGFDALGVIALCRGVPRIELTTGVVPVYARHPVALAQQALTTQAAVGGRLTLGIGLSHRVVVERSWGLSFARPVEYMREYLTVLLPLLRGEAADVDGERITGHAQLTVPDAAPPAVILAALGTKMLQLAGEQTAGTATWMVGPRTLGEHVTPTIAAAAGAAGRPAPRIIVGLPVCVTSDPSAARERAARSFERYGQLPSYRAMIDREGAAGPADLALIGNEREVEAALGRIADAGGTDLAATVFGAGEDQRRTFAFLESLATHDQRTSPHDRHAAV
jgi:F420-dependent oxidoreductase-like protein